MLAWAGPQMGLLAKKPIYCSPCGCFHFLTALFLGFKSKHWKSTTLQMCSFLYPSFESYTVLFTSSTALQIQGEKTLTLSSMGGVSESYGKNMWDWEVQSASAHLLATMIHFLPSCKIHWSPSLRFQVSAQYGISLRSKSSSFKSDPVWMQLFLCSSSGIVPLKTSE